MSTLINWMYVYLVKHAILYNINCYFNTVIVYISTDNCKTFWLFHLKKYILELEPVYNRASGREDIAAVEQLT